MVTRSLMAVVDDDESVRESLTDLLREFAFSGGGAIAHGELAFPFLDVFGVLGRKAIISTNAAVSAGPAATAFTGCPAAPAPEPNSASGARACNRRSWRTLTSPGP
jgi:hypothetical protein